MVSEDTYEIYKINLETHNGRYTCDNINGIEFRWSIYNDGDDAISRNARARDIDRENAFICKFLLQYCL